MLQKRHTIKAHLLGKTDTAQAVDYPLKLQHDAARRVAFSAKPIYCCQSKRWSRWIRATAACEFAFLFYKPVPRCFAFDSWEGHGRRFIALIGLFGEGTRPSEQFTPLIPCRVPSTQGSLHRTPSLRSGNCNQRALTLKRWHTVGAPKQFRCPFMIFHRKHSRAAA